MKEEKGRGKFAVCDIMMMGVGKWKAQSGKVVVGAQWGNQTRSGNLAMAMLWQSNSSKVWQFISLSDSCCGSAAGKGGI